VHALAVLEFDQIRRRLEVQCQAELAAAWAGALEPEFEEAEARRCLDLTAEAADALTQHSPPPLGALKDLRHPLRRAQKGGVLGGAELFAVGEALAAMRGLAEFIAGRRHEYPLLSSLAENLPSVPRLESQLLESLEHDGTVKDAASPALASLRQKKKAAAARIVERIQSYTTGKARDLLSDPIYTVRDGRYVIPLKAENRGKIRGLVHDTSGSGQTLYVEPEDVVQLGNALRETEAAEREEVQRVLESLSGKVGAVAGEAIGGIEGASRIDFAFAKARLGFAMRATLPTRVDVSYLEIHGGRHPLLDPADAVPLDLRLGRGRSVLITGPNTGGKTVAIKTVGLFVLMSQSGLMLPALEVKLGHFTQVWADIGDEQSLQQSLSTFSGHIRNIAEALANLREGALVLLDEVGAGTDPAEGAALARAILSEMAARGATILASTHYGELKAFAFNTDGFENAAMEFDVKTLRPTYRLLMGAPGASHALRIAERYGIPRDVVERAKEGLGEQAQDVALMLERLELAQRQARIAQGEADRRAAELKRAEAAAAQKLAEAEEIRRTVHGRANEAVEAALREIRLEAARVFEELKASGTDAKAQERARRGLKELQDVARDFAQELAPKVRPAARPPEEIRKGMTVRVDGFAQSGTVLEDPKGGSALVQIGPMKMTVPVGKLSASVATPADRKPKTNVGLQKAMSAPTEIHLRNMRAEDAVRELEKFVDDALLAGLSTVRIVHGKGEGILRQITHDYLRRQPGVASFRLGEPGEGGDGVTVASLK
jgi:DNA mismatch repair protein MutS2